MRAIHGKSGERGLTIRQFQKWEKLIKLSMKVHAANARIYESARKRAQRDRRQWDAVRCREDFKQHVAFLKEEATILKAIQRRVYG